MSGIKGRSGRKSLPKDEKKEQVCIWLEKKKIKKHGGFKTLQKKLSAFAEIAEAVRLDK